MANLVMGAMGSLIPKLYQLLKDEYKLQTGVTERIRSLTKELEVAQAALRKVAEVPWDQLDEQVQLWACDVRESSYDMEDVVDTFLVRVQGPDSAEQEESLLKRLKKIFKKTKARRKISADVQDIMSHLQEVMNRCRRYKLDDIVAKPAAASTIDPRLHAMYTQVDKLVGIDESSSKLSSMLELNNMSNIKMKTVSIVGIGGLGKTTLAKAVFDNLRGDFNCRAFVSVGRNPDLQKVLQMIIIALDKEAEKFNFTVLQDITQFINKLREVLQKDKRHRYFIVIDDVWEKQSWEILKFAIPDDKSCQCRIILTTRKLEVANNADEVYELPALPHDSSKKLFYTRVYGDETACVDYQPDEVSDEILRKCGGIPLAIITISSLLVHKPMDKWLEVYNSIGFGCKGNVEAENTIRILSFSYYDLPPHLKTCLLYLSAFPEDSFICKASLVRMWVAEGFVVENQERKPLFQIGEVYFNDLVNRSMIQEVEHDYKGNYVHGCRVHDMVLDFIRSMSCAENFFTVFDINDQGTLAGSNNVVRRLADHNETMVHSYHANKMFGMPMVKVRSFFALDWATDTWAPLHSFKFLRVLNIGYHRTASYFEKTRTAGIEHLGLLLHLRFLGLNGRQIEKIPGEIGDLKLLQTLDLMGSSIDEEPSSSSLPAQLVCLRMVLNRWDRDDKVFSVGRLTSLEELSIRFKGDIPQRRFLKELGSLRELRVLDAWIFLDDDESKSYLVESVRQIHKLQHLRIAACEIPVFLAEGMEFVLPGDLRSFRLCEVELWKMPSCIDPLCHPNLSRLDLCLSTMDERELKILGRLPELHFLRLDLQGSSPTISNINDRCYFPKLRCLRLPSSLVLFVANQRDDGKMTASFHIWDGEEDEEDSDDQYGFSVSRWETARGLVGEKNDDELQLQRRMAMLSVSDDELPSSFQSSRTPVFPDGEKKGSITHSQGEGAATSRFMPRLQELYFKVREQAVRDPRYCNSLGMEFLSSLREISVHIDLPLYIRSMQVKEVEAALRRAAQDHPNRPTLRIVSP